LFFFSPRKKKKKKKKKHTYGVPFIRTLRPINIA
jgi:hypothetical protein